LTLFDTPTAFLMVSMAASLMPGITWIVLARHRSAAINLWCGGGFVMAMSYTLIGLRGEAPTWMTYSLAYLLIFTHILLRGQSLRLDLARPWRPSWMILAAGVFQYLRQKSGCLCMNSSDFRGLENPVVD